MTKRRAVYILAVTILVVTVAVVCTLPTTFGRFVRSFSVNDSAVVAKFDVVITVPEEFDGGFEQNDYQHSFFEREGQMVFDFTVTNNGEVDVNCNPYIIGVLYSILVSGEPRNEFIVKAGESVEFQLVIVAFNLTKGTTEADFIIDVEQYIGE